MGCGASKSSKVALDVIGTKPQTAAPVDGNNGDVSSGDCQRVPPVYISAEPQTAEIQEGTDHPDQSAESNDRHSEQPSLIIPWLSQSSGVVHSYKPPG